MASSNPEQRPQLNARLPVALIKRAQRLARKVAKQKAVRVSVTTLIRVGLERVCREIEETGTLDLHVGEKASPP